MLNILNLKEGWNALPQPAVEGFGGYIKQLTDDYIISTRAEIYDIHNKTLMPFKQYYYFKDYFTNQELFYSSTSITIQLENKEYLTNDFSKTYNTRINKLLAYRDNMLLFLWKDNICQFFINFTEDKTDYTITIDTTIRSIVDKIGGSIDYAVYEDDLIVMDKKNRKKAYKINMLTYEKTEFDTTFWNYKSEDIYLSCEFYQDVNSCRYAYIIGGDEQNTQKIDLETLEVIEEINFGRSRKTTAPSELAYFFDCFLFIYDSHNRIFVYDINNGTEKANPAPYKGSIYVNTTSTFSYLTSNDTNGKLNYIFIPRININSKSSLLPLNENIFDRDVTNGNAELSLKQTIYAKEKPELALLLQEKACAQDGASLSLKERILISDKSDLELQEKIYIKSQKDLKIKENAYMGGHSKLTLNQTIYAPEKAQLNLKERIQESIKTSLSIKEIIYTQEKTLLSLKERCAISKNVSLPLKETVTSSSSNPLNLQVGWNVIPKAETPILKNAYIEKFNDDYIFFRNGKVYDIQNDKLYDNIVAFNYFKDEYTGQEVFWSYDYMALRTPNGEITQIEKARTNVIFAYRDNQIFAYSSNVITKYKVIFSEDGSSFELDYSDQSLKQLVIELSKDFKVMESAFYGDDILIFDRYNRETVYKINIFTQEVQTFTTQWQSYKDITPYEHCNLFLVDALYKDTAYIIGRYYDTTQMIDLKTLEVIKTIKYGVTQEVFDFYVADEHIFLYNSSLVRTKHLLDTSHKYEDGVGNDYCNGGVSSSFAYFCVQDSDKGETRIFVPRIEKRKKAITLALKENIVQQDAIFENVKLPLKQTVYGQSAPESALTVQEKVYAQNQIDFAIKESVIVSGKANLSLKQNIFAEPSGSAKLSIKEDIRRSEYYYVYHCDTEHPHDLPSTINLSGLFNLDSYIQNDVIKAVAVSHSKARGYFTFETFAPNARLTIEADYTKSSPEMRAGVMAYIDDSENLGYAGTFIVEKPGKHRFKFEVINEADYGTIVYMINRMIIPYMPDGPLGFNVFKLKETIDFSGLEEEGNAKLSLKERACAMWGEEFRVRERIINTAKTQLSLKEKVILGNYQTLVMYERTKAKDKAQLNLKVNAISANSKALTLKETIQAQDKQTLTLNLTIYAKEKQVLSLKQKIIVQEARNLALKERIVLEANQTLALKEKAVKSGFKALKLKSYIIAEQSQDSLTLKETIKAPSKSTLTLQEKAIEQAKQTLNVKENIESLTGFGALSLKERVIVTDKALLDIQEKIYGFKSKTLSMQELIKQEGAQTVYVVEKVVFPFIPLVETILLDGYRTRLLSSNKPIALLNRKERKQ